jgi:hypothetical protein
MEVKEWLRASVVGLAVGGLATAFIGFSWGGWMTMRGAEVIAAERGAGFVAVALTPYCVAAANLDPNFAALMDSMKAGTSYDREKIVANAGWATPLGATAPLQELASACHIKLFEGVV